MDTFFELIVKRQKTPFDKALIALIVFAAIVVVFLLFLLPAVIPVISSLVLPLQALAVYLGYRFICTRNIEFEYCVTGGDLDVDKIINKQKRRRIAAISSKNITIMAPEGDSRLPSIEGREIIKASSGTNENTVYVVVYEDNGSKALIFEPTREMVEQMQKRNPRNIFVQM